MSEADLAQIKAVVLDVDGVLTDGAIYWGSGTEEWKRISFLDIMGVSIGQRAGLRFALISGEDGPLLDRLVQRLGIAHVYGGCKDKAGALRDFATNAGLSLAQICYIGDDLNDVPAMHLAGFAAAPASAHKSAREAARVVTESDGGHGAVREIVDLLVKNASV